MVGNEIEKKMKVVIISTVYGSPWAGSEEHWYFTALSLLKKGCEVTCSLFEVSSKCIQHNQLREFGANIEYRKRSKRWSWHLRWRNTFNSFRNLKLEEKDLIILSVGSLPDLYMYPDVLRILNKNKEVKLFIICTFNSDYLLPNLISQETIKGYLRRANGILFYSEQNKKLAERQYAINLTQSKVYPSALSIPITNSSYRPLIETSTSFSMALVGRLDVYNKGQDVLLETLSSDKWKARNWYLTFYGDGGDKSYIQSLIEFYQLEDKVKFGGFISDVFTIWESNNLLVMPSRSEGQSLAFLEAMLCGRICVATDVGGFAEVIKDGENGFLAEAPVAKYIDNALERAWNAQNKFNIISKQAHDCIIDLYKQDPIEKTIHWLENL
jgi:glycosyltransferase involved in cell wall biosynthesis